MNYKIKQKRFGKDSIQIRPESQEKLGFLKYKTGLNDYSGILFKIKVKCSQDVLKHLKFRGAAEYDFDYINSISKDTHILCKNLSKTITISNDRSFSSIGIGFGAGTLENDDTFTIVEALLVEDIGQDCQQVSEYNTRSKYEITQSDNEIIFRFRNFVKQKIKVKDIMNVDSEIVLKPDHKYVVKINTGVLYLLDFYGDKQILEQKVNSPLTFLNSDRYELELNIEKTNRQEEEGNSALETALSTAPIGYNNVLANTFGFNKDISLNTIAYKKIGKNKYRFLFRIDAKSNLKNPEKYVGYIRYYNDEVIDKNKFVKSFPLTLSRSGEHNFILTQLSIEDPKISRFDVYFMDRNTHEASNFYTVWDLNLNDETKVSQNNTVENREKLLKEVFVFNEHIKIDEISYQNLNGNDFEFLFKIDKESTPNSLDDFVGYIRYYNGEINDQNKRVKSFPLKFIEVDGDKYIFARVDITNLEISRFDVFFLHRETKNVSKFFTLTDLKITTNNN